MVFRYTILFRSIFFFFFLAICGSHSLEGATIKTEDSKSHSTPLEEELVAKDHLMHHLANEYSWHLYGDVYIPLPVILITKKGLECFSSSQIRDHRHFKGKYYSYKLSHGQISAVNYDGTSSPILLDISITKNVASMLVAAILIFIVFTLVGRSYAKSYKLRGALSFVEPFILFVRDEIAKPNLGQRYHKYMPFLLTLFFFIWLNNLFGLLPFPPGGVNATGNISVTLALGLISFVVINFSGSKHYWKHIFKPDVPFYLLPIMIIVEFIGALAKPFALIVRLFANITAGHIIITSLVFLIFIFKSVYVAPVSIAFSLFMNILELLVGFLQAYIFTLLTALFLGAALKTGEEH